MNHDIGDVLKRLNIEAKGPRGREWTARCPNTEHEDKNPSWRIRDEPGERHGRHNCFGCGFGGSLRSLVMFVLGLDARGATVWLGGDATRIKETPDEIVVQSRERAPKFRFPAGAQFPSFSKWTRAPREYLLGRKVTERQIERWGLGYAVDGRLAGRVILPYRNAQLLPCMYTARLYRETDAQRYLQPKKDENPDRNILFGEAFWPPLPTRDRPNSRPFLVVNEGEFNVLAIERAMGELVPQAALAGSELSTIQIAKLVSFQNVIILSDPDAAGDKLFVRMQGALARYVTLKRVELQPGKDADSTDPEELETLLKRAVAEVLI